MTTHEENFDVIVIGGGGSGLAAAVEAAENSSRVLLIEKAPQLGGTTAMAVGSITASGSRYQRRLGIIDSPEEHLEDYRSYAGSRVGFDNPELAKLLTENVGAIVDWLNDLGVEFFGPVQEPPHRKPRTHNVLPSARSYIHHLSRRARKLGVKIRLGTSALKLLQNGDRIYGVLAEQNDGTQLRYFARTGIVLAGGDFSNDIEFRRQHFGEATTSYAAANPFATGDCQRLAVEIGARICNPALFEGAQMRFPPAPNQSWMLKIPPYRAIARGMRLALGHLPSWLIRPFAMGFVTTYLAPDPRLFSSGALIVNRHGRRITELTAASTASEPSAPPGAYVILDAALYNRFCSYPHYIATAPNVAFAYASDFRRNRRDIFFEAENIRDLARSIGVSAAHLDAAVTEQNGLKEPDMLAIRTSPYMALGPVLPYVLTTHGGLAVSTDLEVLDTDDRPILGLYAAGSAGRGGLVLPGHGHSLGWAFTSGRMAGRNAAAGIQL